MNDFGGEILRKSNEILYALNYRRKISIWYSEVKKAEKEVKWH